MKQLILFAASWCLTLAVSAQAPANDDCSNPVKLGLAPVCTNNVYTNINATPSNIGSNNQPSCPGGVTPARDVWFTFICPTSPLDFRIELTGTGTNPIKNPVLTVYRGSCAPGGLAELGCLVAPVGATTLFLDVEALTPGATYFIRVWDFSATGTPSPGTFNLCVNKIPPILTVDQGGSTLCAGTLYDTGGPDQNYGLNGAESHLFTICPAQPAACITFTLDYFHVDAGAVPGTNGQDVLSFFDGKDDNAPLLAQINGFDLFTGTVGGGGVSFQVQASSGCLTVGFVCDGFKNNEGFKGHWECSDQPCTPDEALNVETSVLETDLVNAVLAPGTKVDITKVDCPGGAVGTFDFATDNNYLGLQKGLLLTSGNAVEAIGPNSLFNASMQHGAPGDNDLNYLSFLLGAFSKSYDACVVEMDVYVATDELTFEYVFGSEEYPEYVNNQYNDIFAFLTSGPGILGDPNLGGARNIALLPGTTIPVQINSVNNLQNWEYYRNNGVLKGSSLAYDGFTSDYKGIKKSLTARVDVTPCNTYHLKLAVADRGDDALDSGVFISEIKGGAPNLAVQFSSGVDYFIENCSGNLDQLVVTLDQPKTVPVSYTVTVGGSAIRGLDYLLSMPPVITFQPGDTVLYFPIVPISDSELEGTETITLSISKDFGCGTVVFKTIVVDLKDNAEVVINSGADTLFVCPGGTAQLEASGALSYFWEPPLAVSNANIANPTTTPTQDIWLKVTGSIGTCTDEDSIFVKLINVPTLQALALTKTEICQGDTVQLAAVSNAGTAGIQWTPKSRLSDPGSPTPQAFPLGTTTYTATLSIAGCPPVSSAVTIKVDTLFFPVLTTIDTTICQHNSVKLAEDLHTSTLYQWSPPDGLSDAQRSGPLATPSASTVYTLTATSANGYCAQQASVNVQVIPALVDISGDPYREICLGDTVFLSASASPAGGIIQWQPTFYVQPTSGPNVQTAPDESITVIATYSINNCLAIDSVRIRVDSLPDLAIRREKDKSVYCPGDTIYLLSKTYEPASFPDMTQEWDPFGGQLTPVEHWNMVILATMTHTFRRISVNHACVDTATVDVVVGTPPTINISADPPQICAGSSSQITATVSPNMNIEWEDPTGTLSCKNCLTPTATPFGTTTYNLSTPGADCPGGGSVTISVLPLPALDLSPKTICLGDTVVLNNIPTNPQDTYTWTVSPSGTPLATVPNPPVAPSATTTYQVVASGACTNQGTTTVTVNSAVLNAGAPQTICFGTTTTLTATTSGTAGTVVWNPSGLTGNSVQVTPIGTTTYTALLTFQPNCSALDSVKITVIPPILLGPIQATPLQDTICEGTELHLRTNVSTANVTLMWTENGTDIAGATLDSIKVTPSSDERSVLAEYKVIATDANGCTTASSFQQWVKRCFFFPNAFTPNNDNDNDTFSGLLSLGGNLQVVAFQVFNRWGQKVFEATDSQKAWDGRVDGKDAPSDVYAYYLIIRFANGEERKFKGDVTLLR